MNPILLQVDVGYACGGVVIEDGKVTECAPIFRRDLMGRRLDYVEWWVNAKGGKLYEVERTAPIPRATAQWQAARARERK